MTYNIRGYVVCDTLKTPSHHWYYRKKNIIKVIKEESPDVLAVQEIFNIQPRVLAVCNNKKYIGGYLFDKLISKDIEELKRQKIYVYPPKHLVRDFMREKLKELGYSYFYKSGGSPKIIFYKNKSFSFVSGGQFYQNNKKSTTYVFLKNRDNKIILFVNTHLISGKNYAKLRLQSFNYILGKLSIINKNKYPVVLMGDLNIDYLSKEYKMLMKSLVIKSNLKDYKSGKYESTFNGFGRKNKKIDYILCSNNIKITSSKVIKKVYNVKKKRLISYDKKQKDILFPSDHWPLVNILELKDN